MNLVQCLMARGALGWSTRQLASAAGIFVDTVRKFQMGHATSDEDRRLMREAFEAAGVIFIEENGEGPGFRLRKRVKSQQRLPVGPATDAINAMDAAIAEHRKMPKI